MKRVDERPKPLVYYTHWVPDEGPALLRPHCRVVICPTDHPPSENEIATQAGDAFALCFSVCDRVSASLLERCPSLKVISSYARGSDNVDVEAATRLGIWVATIDTAMTDSVADMAWALLLSLARKVIPGDRIVRHGWFTGWEPRPAAMGSRVSGRTLGIVGMGQVGRAVARRASGFGMRVLCTQPDRLTPAQEDAVGARWVTRPELLAQSDFIVLCSPLTEDTFHQIGEAELHVIKPSAMVVNVSRGSEVDEEAAARALNEGRLAGYATDVFEMEDWPAAGPIARPVRSVPASLVANRDRTVLTPHISTAVEEVRVQIALAQAGAVLDVLEGRRPAGAVNEPLGRGTR
ncbi:MAG: hydroxyacid dehydrogenase [Bacillota bacterium]|nr:MAG: hydroxyacid dehydrogenase [Bacillota bacterium]